MKTYSRRAYWVAGVEFDFLLSLFPGVDPALLYRKNSRLWRQSLQFEKDFRWSLAYCCHGEVAAQMKTLANGGRRGIGDMGVELHLSGTRDDFRRESETGGFSFLLN